MKLLPNQADEASLLRFAEDAIVLLERREFHSLAERFGYIFAGKFSPAAAIELDLNGCIARYRSSGEKRSSVPPSMVVTYFKPNDSGLFAVVECEFVAPEGCAILAELIVTSAGEDKYLSLEEVSLITA